MSLCGQTPRKEGRARVLSQPPAGGKTITAFPGTQGARAEPTSAFSRAVNALSIAGSALHKSAWLCLCGGGRGRSSPHCCARAPATSPGPPPRPLVLSPLPSRLPRDALPVFPEDPSHECTCKVFTMVFVHFRLQLLWLDFISTKGYCFVSHYKHAGLSPTRATIWCGERKGQVNIKPR